MRPTASPKAKDFFIELPRRDSSRVQNKPLARRRDGADSKVRFNCEEWGEAVSAAPEFAVPAQSEGSRVPQSGAPSQRFDLLGQPRFLLGTGAVSSRSQA